MKVSNQLYDAWKVKPPCEVDGQCYHDCPHYNECNNEIDEDYESDL